jgi:hypothetical protein
MKLLVADLFTRTNSLKGGEKMDWNHDGKHDWQDHAFYNNVVEPGMKRDEPNLNGKSNKTTQSNSSKYKGSGGAFFIGLCVLYLIIKLIGG